MWYREARSGTSLLSLAVPLAILPAAMPDKPSSRIVTCDYRPKRTRKRRKSPEIKCGVIVTIAPRKRDLSRIPVGVMDGQQRAERIRQYLAAVPD